MKFDLLTSPISGVITPLLTPFTPEGKLDVPALERLVEHTIRGGIKGLFILGTTGEGPCLSFEQRCELITKVTGMVGGRIPVMAGITDTSYDVSVKLIRFAEDSGIDGLVVTPPPYFTSSQKEALQYFESIATLTRVPWFLYNIPSLTKCALEIDTVVRATAFSGMSGFKDSSGNMIYFNKVLRALKGKEGIPLYVGPEEFLAEAVLMGAAGGVHGGSNIFPELYVMLYDAAIRRNLERVNELHDIVMDVSSHLYSLSKFENHCIRVVKFLLSRLGICEEAMARPYLGLSDENKRIAEDRLEAILSRMEKAGLSGASLCTS